MLTRSPWFDLGGASRNRQKDGAGAFACASPGQPPGHAELHRTIRNDPPATRVHSKTNEASEACESKLDEIVHRMEQLKQALRKRAGVEQEHGDLAYQIRQQRAEVRERERELAMELARIDSDLGSSKAKLASLKSHQSAESFSVLQKASSPVAVEMQWACRHAEAAGAHTLVSPVAVSPRADLLHPKPSEVVGTLESGTPVKVVGILRVPEIGKVRARIQKPLKGWISLLDLEVPKRWAKSIEVSELDSAWAGNLIEDGVASRSSLLRGWAAKVDSQQMAFFESVQDISAEAPTRTANSIQPVKVARVVRKFTATNLSRSAVEKALEAQTEQMKLDRERAGMELGQAESEAFMLAEKVDSAAARNRTLSVAVSRLDSFLKQLATYFTLVERDVFGLLSFWRKRDEEDQDFWPGVYGGKDMQLPAATQLGCQSEEVSAVEALPLIAEDLSECEQEANSGQTRIDAMLRNAEELQRQRGERMQELADLRRRFSTLRAAVCNNSSTRELVVAQCRLWRVRQVFSQVASDAIAEIKVVEAWTQSLQLQLAQLLDVSAPPKATCSWLSEFITKWRSCSPLRKVSTGVIKNKLGDPQGLLQSLQQLLNEAELRRTNDAVDVQRPEELQSPVETLQHLEWVAQQLHEQHVQMNQRHEEEVKELEDRESEHEASESDLMQLQLKHENESLQMARLVQEHEARLAYQMKLHEEYEVRDVRKDEIGNAQDLESVALGQSGGEMPERRTDLQDCSPRVTMAELGARLSEALHQFRPCSGKCEGETRLGSGARSLWWLAASIAALTWYTEAELQDMGVPPKVDTRREFYSLADSRFARERRYEDEWREALPPRPSPLVSPFSVDRE